MASVGSSWCVVVLVLTSPSTAMGGAGAWSSRNFLLHYTPRELSAKSNYLLFAMFILFLKSLGMMPSRGQFLKYEFLFLIKFMGLESRCIQAQACTGPEAHIWSSWIWSYNWFWVIEHGCWKPNWGPLQEQYMLFNQWTLSPTPLLHLPGRMPEQGLRPLSLSSWLLDNVNDSQELFYLSIRLICSAGTCAYSVLWSHIGSVFFFFLWQYGLR